MTKRGFLYLLVGAFAATFRASRPVDEKAGVARLMELLDVDDRDELIAAMYPDA